MKGDRGIIRIIVVIALGSLIWWVFSGGFYELGRLKNASNFVEDFQERNDVESASSTDSLEEDIVVQEIVAEKDTIKTEVFNETVTDVVENTKPVVEYFDEKIDDVIDIFSTEVENIISTTQEIANEVSNSGTLIAIDEGVGYSELTASGIFYYTNFERTNEGLTTLKRNGSLDEAASIKVDDMFEGQYFEHMSPSGRDVTGLAEMVFYEYISVGENLAMGNFDDDKGLVDGWMNSPGHRANILGSQYTEIGISVKQGVYEGHKIWMGVQTFGRPLSDCPTVDERLGNNIDVERVVIEATSVLIDSMRQEIVNYHPKRGAVYNNMVVEFNALVEDYNSSALDLKLLVNEYNSQVNEFNICIAE